MSGAEASFWLAFLGLYLVMMDAVSAGESGLTPRRVIMLAIGIVCIAPGFLRLWIAAVAG